MLTAYSTKPRLGTDYKPKPKFDSLDDLIAAMKADAKQIKQRQKDNIERPAGKTQVPDEDILAFIKENPGCTAKQIGHAFGRNACVMRTRLGYMEDRAQVSVSYKRIGRNSTKTYRIGKNGVPHDLAPRRRKLAQFIADNPGCTTREAADHMGLSVKTTYNAIRNLKNFVKVETKSKGGNTPARHWVKP